MCPTYTNNQKATVRSRPISCSTVICIKAHRAAMPCIGEASNRFPECGPTVQSRGKIHCLRAMVPSTCSSSKFSPVAVIRYSLKRLACSREPEPSWLSRENRSPRIAPSTRERNSGLKTEKWAALQDKFSRTDELTPVNSPTPSPCAPQNPPRYPAVKLKR